MHSSDEHANNGTLKMVPILARIALGLNKSVLGSAMMTASTPAASAVRMMAPKLPGFATVSKTIISGFFFGLKSFSLAYFGIATAKSP
jgi:hypothetical protein